MLFPVAGIEVNPLLPPFAAFSISLITAPAGVTGAFLILPFQISVLGFTGPAVSPTNLLYNIVAVPSGVYAYFRERRMVWPLAATIVAGTTPGVLAGVIIRMRLLPDPKSFKIFVGAVLLYLGSHLLYKSLRRKASAAQKTRGSLEVRTLGFSLFQCRLEMRGDRYAFNPALLFSISLLIGVIGGTYGIGGGAILAPFCALFFGLPLYLVAGATLLGTFVTSIFGIAFYILLGAEFSSTGAAVHPDWALGLLFGLGGAFGMYCGARMQRFIPERGIRVALGILIFGLSLKYLSNLL